jgi:3-mercaptopyruvate sulfurtransferase SseA
MNLSKWFIRPEQLVSVEHLFLWQVTEEVTNDLETDENEYFWKYRSLHEIQHVLTEKYRLSLEHCVVLYTRDELMAAARVAWLLHWLGWPFVRLLIGPIENIEYERESVPSISFPDRVKRPEVRLLCSDLTREQSCTQTRFLDVRTREEYDGVTCGYPFVRHAGHISFFQLDPLDGLYGHIRGDISWDALLVYLKLMMDNYSPWKKSHRIVYMCGTGWRASLSAIFADVLQLADVICVLDSGWYEWSERFLSNRND